jgi:hypothetical protein
MIARSQDKAVDRCQINWTVRDEAVSLHERGEDEEELHSRKSLTGALALTHTELHHSVEEFLQKLLYGAKVCCLRNLVGLTHSVKVLSTS